jgi:hypothetical protein
MALSFRFPTAVATQDMPQLRRMNLADNIKPAFLVTPAVCVTH